MIQLTDQDNRHWWLLDRDEIRLGFLAQCIERISEVLGQDYNVVFDRLESAGLTEGFILKHYDTLHSQSIENAIEDILTALRNKEER